MKLSLLCLSAFSALCILYINTEGREYTYAQDAEEWAIEECGEGNIRELKFHGDRKIRLECKNDKPGDHHVWDRSTRRVRDE